MKSARLIAFETLYKIFYDDSYSNIALDKALKNVNSDKAFISALVYGVVERRLTLDYFINKFTQSRPKPKIMTILRLGAYQLLFMDKVPSGAAINESVKLCKEIKQDFYSKLVNAVLHKIDNDRDIPDNLSVKYSVPEHLINMWIKQYTRDTVEKFLPAVNDRPPVFAIPNALFLDAEELSYELTDESIENEIINDVCMINSGFDLSKSKAFNNGLFYIEDLSSYNCAKALNAKSGDIVLDVCSAPGGKAFTIAGDMKNKGELYSYDLYEHRVKLIEESKERLGFTCIKTGVNDALKYNPEIPMADKIICDVVCSGFGIIRRKPEIRYKNLDDIKELPKIQLDILSTSSRYLKQGGQMIYSTCTLNKKENEMVVREFLNNNSDFSLINEKTTFPTQHGGDGFYWALLKKNEN